MRSMILAAALAMGAAGSVQAATIDYTFNLDRVSGWLENISSGVRIVVGIDAKTNEMNGFAINGVDYWPAGTTAQRGNDDTDPKKWTSQYTELSGERGGFKAEFETGWAAGPEDEPSSGGWTAVLNLFNEALGFAYASSSDDSAPVGVCRQ